MHVFFLKIALQPVFGPILGPFFGLNSLSSCNPQCHERQTDYGAFMKGVNFWIEGVALLVVSIFGMVGNVTTVIVLRRIDSNTTFNRLLMSLCELMLS